MRKNTHKDVQTHKLTQNIDKETRTQNRNTHAGRKTYTNTHTAIHKLIYKHRYIHTRHTHTRTQVADSHPQWVALGEGE